MRSKGTLGKLKIASDIVWEMKDKYKDINVFDKNTFVIHLRLGDILVGEYLDNSHYIRKKYTIYTNQYSKSYCNIEKIINELKLLNSNINIIIVTCIHYGKLLGSPIINREIQKIIKGLSYKKLDELVDTIHFNFPNKFKISLQSRNPDEDFFTMCLANKLILSGKSSYGAAAIRLNKILKSTRIL